MLSYGIKFIYCDYRAITFFNSWCSVPFVASLFCPGCQYAQSLSAAGSQENSCRKHSIYLEGDQTCWKTWVGVEYCCGAIWPWHRIKHDITSNRKIGELDKVSYWDINCDDLLNIAKQFLSHQFLLI